MILLSPGGTLTREGEGPAQSLLVGTVEGVFLYQRIACCDWLLEKRGLEGVFVSSLTRMDNGAIIAGTHGMGVARSDDGGRTWRLCNRGLTHVDIWVVKREQLHGRERLFAGSLPAHLFVSDDGGESWCELPGLREVPSAGHWLFPPPPHIGHVKDIEAINDCLYVGIEVGALLRSDDGGRTFTELPVDPDVGEVDIHKLALNVQRPARIIAATGWGIIISEDGGASWQKGIALPRIDYPVPLVIHPQDPDLLFVAGGEGWPPNWYALGRSRARIARSRDGGLTWERLLGGLPDGQRATYGALAIDTWPCGCAVYAADTDGQIFESCDGGDTWRVVAEAAPVSKGDQYRGLAKNRPYLMGVDALKPGEAGGARMSAFGTQPETA